MQLVRKQTYITDEQDRALKRMARQYDVSEAEVLRRVLDSWIASEQAKQYGDPFAALVGFFDGPAEVNHDDIYRY